MKKRTALLLMVLTFIFGAASMYIGIGWYGNMNISAVTTEQGMSEKDLKKLNDVYKAISSQYVSGVKKDKLIEGAVNGMVGSLDDPYTSYMSEKEAKQFMESLGSSFQGIGAEVGLIDGRVTIISPIKDTPAEKAGLKPNDTILEIDGKSTEGKSVNDAVKQIRGEKGTEVTLKILRSGSKEPFNVKIVRDDIPLITVHSNVENENGKKVGVIEITSFSEETAKEFSTQLEKLEKENIDGLVIDVRGNPGGYLTSVEEILGELITKEKPYLQIEDKQGNKEPYYTRLTEQKPYPIVGLIDNGSASASEILAGALKEAGKYEIVGEKSFGKGTVQQTMEIGDGSQLKVTMFKWLTPEGNWIHKKGIKPTIEVKQPEYYYVAHLDIDQPLTLDTTSEQVKNAQLMLSGLGFDPARTDGYFNDTTKSAVEAFQQAHDLPVTGEIDEATAGTLESKTIEKIRSKEDDRQLQQALEIVTK